MNESLTPLTALAPRVYVTAPPGGWPALIDFTLRHADGSQGPPEAQLYLPTPFWTTLEEPIKLTVSQLLRVLWSGSVQLSSIQLSEQEVGGVVHRAIARLSPMLGIGLGDLKLSGEGADWLSRWVLPVDSPDGGPVEVMSENNAVERLRGMGKAASRRWLRREGLSVETVPAGEGGRKRPVRMVYWPDVVERLRRRDKPGPPPPTKRRTPRKKTVLGVVPGRLGTDPDPSKHQ